MSPQYRRRKKLAHRRLQLRLIGLFSGLCVLAMLTQSLVLAGTFLRTADSLPTGGEQIVEALPGALAWSLFIALLAVLPALFLVGLDATFRVAGPIRGMERHLKQIASGEWPGPCRIRKKDELQDFCETLNAALESARAQGQELARQSDGEAA